MTDKPLTVEQVDREAAASYARDTEGESILAFNLANGRHDANPRVQAFARHRINALATRPTEAREGMVMILRECDTALNVMSATMFVAGLDAGAEAADRLRTKVRAALAAAPQPTTDLRSDAVREAVVNGLKAFVSCEPDFDMSPSMRNIAADHVLAQPGIFATAIRGRE